MAIIPQFRFAARPLSQKPSAGVRSAAPPSAATAMGSNKPSPQRPGIVDRMHKLANESWHQAGQHKFRIGIASTPWQQLQARSLFLSSTAENAASAAPDGNDCIALALSVSLCRFETPALATLSLRQDSPHGLPADARHGRTLEALRRRGAKLAELRTLAGDGSIAITLLLPLLTQALVEHIQALDDTTDLIMECSPAHAAFYKRMLGLSYRTPDIASQSKQLLHVEINRLDIFPQALCDNEPLVMQRMRGIQ